MTLASLGGRDRIDTYIYWDFKIGKVVMEWGPRNWIAGDAAVLDPGSQVQEGTEGRSQEEGRSGHSARASLAISLDLFSHSVKILEGLLSSNTSVSSLFLCQRFFFVAADLTLKARLHAGRSSHSVLLSLVTPFSRMSRQVLHSL